MNKYELEAFDIERQGDLRKLRERLRVAKPEDFQVILTENPEYPYAAAWAGCHDIAIFKRKADCERFIASFAVHEGEAK